MEIAIKIDVLTVTSPAHVSERKGVGLSPRITKTIS
jgi:hypothetical protein